MIMSATEWRGPSKDKGPSRDVLLNPGTQGRSVRSTRPLRQNLAVAKQDERRDVADVVLRRQLTLGLGVDLEKPDVRLKLARHALVGGRHRLAGAAPVGPEVDHDRNVVALQVGRKTLVRYGDWRQLQREPIAIDRG